LVNVNPRQGSCRANPADPIVDDESGAAADVENLLRGEKTDGFEHRPPLPSHIRRSIQDLQPPIRLIVDSTASLVPVNAVKFHGGWFILGYLGIRF